MAGDGGETGAVLYLVSDSTGEVLDVVARAVLAQFGGRAVERHVWPMLRTGRMLGELLAELRVAGTPVLLHTVRDRALRALLEEGCRALGVPVVAVLAPVVAEFERVLGPAARLAPEARHPLDAAYFSRIDAIDWTIAHDDGALMQEWADADVLLVGVSRTSKTPTALYLANRGLRVANFPIVTGRPLPGKGAIPERGKGGGPLVVGLTIAPARLLAVRYQRMVADGAVDFGESYLDLDRIGQEVQAARRLFARRGWPRIDVTERSIEETAAAVLNLLRGRRAGEK